MRRALKSDFKKVKEFMNLWNPCLEIILITKTNGDKKDLSCSLCNEHLKYGLKIEYKNMLNDKLGVTYICTDCIDMDLLSFI